MYITTISLSYLFLGICFISLAFSIYFRILFIKTSPDNKSRNKIIKDMKDPLNWRERNNKLSYVFLFWAVVSISFYVYLKFFYMPNLISAIYILIYIALIVATTFIFGTKNKATH